MCKTIMGSGSKRDPSDNVVVQIRHQNKGAGDTGGGAGRGNTNDINYMCPSSFQIKLPKATNVRNGDMLTIKEHSDKLAVFHLNVLLRYINQNHVILINRCKRLGYQYAAKAVINERQGGVYARFYRQAS